MIATSARAQDVLGVYSGYTGVKQDLNGTISTVYSSVPASTQITIDSAGNVWTAAGSTLTQTSPAGVKLQSFTVPGTGILGLAANGTDIFVDTVGGTNPYNIYKYSSGVGSPTTIASNIPGGRGIAFDALGNLYVTSIYQAGTSQIFEYSGPDYSIKSTIATGIAGNLSDLAFKGNTLLMTNSSNTSIYQLTPDGSTFGTTGIGYGPLSTFATLGAGAVSGYGMAVDAAGNVYVADLSTGTFEIAAGTTTTTKIGSTLNGFNTTDVATGYVGPAAVVPEPGSALLVGAAGLALIIRRRVGNRNVA